MWSFGYKGYSIQGWFDRNECRVVDDQANVIKCNSVHAAKIKITRLLTRH